MIHTWWQWAILIALGWIVIDDIVTDFGRAIGAGLSKGIPEQLTVNVRLDGSVKPHKVIDATFNA